QPEVFSSQPNDAVAMETTVALVSGASRGVGLAIARAYAQRGLHLILTARRQHDLNHVVDELRSTTEVVALAGDVAEARHAERLVEAGLQRFWGIHVLINNASELGPSPMPHLQDLSPVCFEA